MKVIKRYWFHFTSSLFVILLGIAIITFWYQAHDVPERLMAEHILQLKNVFDDIHKTAGIIDFDHQQNYIDFLNVISFEGSQVGSMNLMYPKKWKGPYFKDNPTIQDTYYQVVKTNDGYFIVPGPGVQLNNGKIIGNDIVFDKNADILAMTRNPEQLMFDDKALAAQIMIDKQPTIADLELAAED